MSEKIKINVRSLGLIGLLGGVGGAINAWLCYTNIHGEPPEDPDFLWSIAPILWILLGALHGGLLASVSISMTTWLFKRHWFLRIAGFPLTGWLSGWLSCIPIMFSMTVSMSRGALSASGVWEALTWPLQVWPRFVWETLWQPYFFFGFVGSIYYFFLSLCRQLSQKHLAVHLLMGSLSGSLGFLLLWVEREPWYFSLIHGTIWGALVGWGVWRAQRAAQNPI